MENPSTRQELKVIAQLALPATGLFRHHTSVALTFYGWAQVLSSRLKFICFNKDFLIMHAHDLHQYPVFQNYFAKKLHVSNLNILAYSGYRKTHRRRGQLLPTYRN
jgi:hypothetical protein